MVTCPNCKADIEELGYSEYAQRVMDFGLKNSKGDIYYDNTEYCDNFLKSEWYCRECNKTLFRTEKKAIKFLKGK